MISAIDVYYQNEWNSTCPKEKTFIASWQGLALFSHTMLVVFLPIYIFTAYCILKKTPKSMHSVKWVLLHTHLWSCYMDILLCSLITPYFYFPTISGFPVGLLRILGIPTSAQTFIGLVSGMFMGNSLVSLFENRSSCLPTNRFRISRKSTRAAYYFCSCALIVGYLIPPFMNIPNQETAKLTFLKELPCPSEEFFVTEVFILTVDRFWKNYLWISTGLIVLGIFIQIGFFSTCCIYYLYISTESMISTKTKQYQKSFFIGTIAQAMMPLVFIAVPVASAMLFIYFDIYNQGLNNCIVLVFSLHGFASTLVILIVHHPYRCFIRKLSPFHKSRTDKSLSYVASHATREVRVGIMRRFSNRIQSLY